MGEATRRVMQALGTTDQHATPAEQAARLRDALAHIGADMLREQHDGPPDNVAVCPDCMRGAT